MESTNHYTVLGVSSDAETADIRQAYREALLRVHPDKQPNGSQVLDSPAATLISELQAAYRLLIDPVLRTEYDQQLKEGKANLQITRVSQRPANEISLDEFTQEETTGKGEVTIRWIYPCRCGNIFIVTEDELEGGIHYIGCTGCSEIIWVGYEAVEDVSGDSDVRSNNL